jgi:hypothetical protein
MTEDLIEPMRISWRGRAASGLFAVHTVLLFFPPIPPIVKGSIWSYILSTLAVVFAGMESYHLGPSLRLRWRTIPWVQRALIGAGTIIGLFTAAMVILALAPDVFTRFSREEGVWEPISLACYVCSLVLVWQTGSLLEGAERKHFRLIAGCYALLVLEEVDYLSIFGPLIGRVGGHYAGSLHDLVNLAANDALSTGAVLLVAVGVVGVVALIARFGFIQPGMIRQTLLSGAGIWLGTGLFLLAAGLFKEAGLLDQIFPSAPPEEVTEMTGSLCLAVFALEITSAAMLKIGPSRR